MRLRRAHTLARIQPDGLGQHANITESWRCCLTRAADDQMQKSLHAVRAMPQAALVWRERGR
jgi:hypothetical protein